VSYVLGFKDSSDDALSKTECYITNEDKKKREPVARRRRRELFSLSLSLSVSLFLAGLFFRARASCGAFVYRKPAHSSTLPHGLDYDGNKTTSTRTRV